MGQPRRATLPSSTAVVQDFGAKTFPADGDCGITVTLGARTEEPAADPSEKSRPLREGGQGRWDRGL